MKLKNYFIMYFICGLVGTYIFLHIVSNKIIVATTLALIIAFTASNNYKEEIR